MGDPLRAKAEELEPALVRWENALRHGPNTKEARWQVTNICHALTFLRAALSIERCRSSAARNDKLSE